MRCTKNRGSDFEGETRHAKEKSKPRRGGMILNMDGQDARCLFAVRYLQLRDDVRDEGDDRSTRATLRACVKLSVQGGDYLALSDGTHCCDRRS
jgi:hypothetical protein